MNSSKSLVKTDNRNDSLLRVLSAPIGLEGWPLSRKITQRLEAFEMWVWRADGC